MILTGKAKEDFYTWLKTQDDDFGFIDIEPTSINVSFDNLYEILENALIIEWFDSVGIQIEINICSWNKGYEFSPTIYTNFICIGNMSATCCIDRKTATKQAIKKANEIYNK